MAELFWNYGAMGAGKSLALLSVAHNHERIGKKVSIFTASIDDRFGVGKVTSRLGVSRDAELFTAGTCFDMALIGADVACVLIDEAQFLSFGQVKQLHQLSALHNVPVICYGIRTDFQGNAFEGSAALGVLADRMEELHTMCKCGNHASMNVRHDANGIRVQDGDQIQIGGDASYHQNCPTCFYDLG